jgi:endonuclease G
MTCFPCLICYSATVEELDDLLPDTFCDIEIAYEYYKVCYSQEHLQGFWSFHLLNQNFIDGRQKRTNNFKKDHKVYPSIGPRDYKGSGFDRGHLVPAGDMKLNRKSMSDTFYMTNMSPQRSGFNSGVWRALEEGLRKDVRKYGEAFVVTGPVLQAFVNYPRIKSGVSIPEEYYKIAYFPDAGFMKAYLIPNYSQKGRSYRRFQVTVDLLERITGYDFFSSLNDNEEDKMESVVSDF